MEFFFMCRRFDIQNLNREMESCPWGAYHERLRARRLYLQEFKLVFSERCTLVLWTNHQFLRPNLLLLLQVH